MFELIQQLNFLFALGTLALQIVIVLVVVVFIYERRTNETSTLLSLMRRYGLAIVFFASLIGTILTLVYSEIFGFIPCGLCWLQRVFLYPMVILSAVALWKKDFGIAVYLMWLSVFGAIVGLYQHYLQMGGSELITCPTAGVGADCAKRIVFEFGYITFPLMAVTLFAFIFVTMMIIHFRSPR
jgi:disulfide bond formation protein DsbB